MPYPKRMTELYPVSAEALFYDGTRHLAAGDPAQAEVCFRLVLRLALDLAEAHANLAFAG